MSKRKGPPINHGPFYFINGLFVQEHTGFVVVPTPDGNAAMIRTCLGQSFFAGIIMADWSHPEKPMEGTMFDEFGHSVLIDVHFGPNLTDPKTLSFKKRYEQRNDVISYAFEKKGTAWFGTWSGPAVGEGKSRCITTMVNCPEFFNFDEQVKEWKVKQTRKGGRDISAF